MSLEASQLLPVDLLLTRDMLVKDEAWMKDGNENEIVLLCQIFWGEVCVCGEGGGSRGVGWWGVVVHIVYHVEF